MLQTTLATLILAVISTEININKLPRYCTEESGPVEVLVSYPTTCEWVPICGVDGDREMGYTFGCSGGVPAVMCYESRTEKWSHFPDCGGEKLDDLTE